MSGCVWLGVSSSSSSCLTGVWWWVCVWLGLVKPPQRWHDSESTSGIRMCNHDEALNRKSGVIGLVCKYSKANYIGGLVRARERQQVMRLDWLASLSQNTPYSGMPQIVDPNICTPSRCKNSTLLCLSICRFYGWESARAWIFTGYVPDHNSVKRRYAFEWCIRIFAHQDVPGALYSNLKATATW